MTWARWEFWSQRNEVDCQFFTLHESDRDRGTWGMTLAAQGDGKTVMDTLAEIWSDLIFVSPIEPDDDFFILGGDSFRAIQLAAQIEQMFGLPFSAAEIFEWPVLRDLSGRVEASIALYSNGS